MGLVGNLAHATPVKKRNLGLYDLISVRWGVTPPQSDLIVTRSRCFKKIGTRQHCKALAETMKRDWE
jgi:hypothetical protein